MGAFESIIAGLLLLVICVALWLLIQRGHLLARVASAEAAKASVETALNQALAQTLVDRAEAARRTEGDKDELRRLNDELNKLAMEASECRARLDGLELRRQEDVAHLQRLHGQQIHALADQHALELRGATSLADEKVQAANRVAAAARDTLAQAQTELKAVFASLASDALRGATSQLLEHAGASFAHQRELSSQEFQTKHATFAELARALESRLKETGTRLENLDKSVIAQHGAIDERLRGVHEASNRLRDETGKLVKALREPQVRGRYGEMQLRRVAELAGMRPYCDFVEQDSKRDDDGTVQRPDMIVRLPNKRELVVDAKANLKPYLDAMEASTEEERQRHLGAFADGIVEQAKKLAAKDYWRSYKGSPDFVVMFMPGEQFVDVALSHRHDLLDVLAQHRVMLASPGTLIAMLRAVSVGFQEQKLSETAREVGQLVRKLREQLGVTLTHVHKVGENLGRAVASYNEFVGSYEKRLLPQVNRLADTSPTEDRPMPEIKPLDTTPRVSGLFPSSGDDAPAPPGPGASLKVEQ